MRKKILIIAATHGNEPLGVEVIEKLKGRKLEKYFDYLIANPRALATRQEFIDANLNRVYPGRKNSRLYEERLARNNLRLAKKYRYIIDIHEASQGKDDFIIVPRENISPKFPLQFIDLPRVLLWPNPKGSLSQVLENAIELEFGSFNRDRGSLVAKAEKIVADFIEIIAANKCREFSAKEKYYVYGKLMEGDFRGRIDDLVDFEIYQNEGESFLPLLSRQYLKSGIICYKARRCD